MVKNLPANAGDLRDMGSIPGREDPLEEGMVTHSYSCLENPMDGEPDGLQCIGSQRVRQD